MCQMQPAPDFPRCEQSPACTRICSLESEQDNARTTSQSRVWSTTTPAASKETGRFDFRPARATCANSVRYWNIRTYEKTVGNEEGTVLFVQQHTIFIVVSTMIVLQSDHAAVFQPKCNGTSEVRSSESSLLRPQLRQRPGRGVFVIRVVCQQVLEADQQAARSVFHVRKACVTTLDVL